MIAPYIFDETEDFAVVFKPPRVHTAPLKDNDSLLDWYAAIYPPVMEVCGRKNYEGGLLHRLDYETQGLVLFAKNQKAFMEIIKQQEEGNFIKEYHAVCHSADSGVPFAFPFLPYFIESYFRPFGKGRKKVQPVTIEDLQKKNSARGAKTWGAYYRTEIISIENCGEYYYFTVRLKRGFRHQIRCHLAWKGYPILNDPIYGKGNTGGFMDLCAGALFFTDPTDGRQRVYRLSKKPLIAKDEKPSLFSL